MVFSRLFNRLSRKESQQQEASQTQSSPRKTIVLNANDIEEDRHITILGATGVQKGKAHVQDLKNGKQMEMRADGSSIVRDEEGQIIRTCDVMRVKREYQIDSDSGELMVKRFGIWTKPQDARLDEDGTLFFRTEDVQVEERLNGLHIHTNIKSGVSIQTHHHNGFELVKLANGEIWKRETTSEKELFMIWKHGKLTFKSETFFSPIRVQAESPSEAQLLQFVSRSEQSWSNGVKSREKYTFTNPNNNKKDVTLQIQLGTGVLILKQVTQVLTTFKEGVPHETTYSLKQSTKLKIDIPGKTCQLSEVVKVRVFDADPNIGIAFDTTSGDEYIVFSGGRGLGNRNRVAEALSIIDSDLEEHGSMLADMVLR